MPFSRESLDFLFENKLNDDKNWYEEHKDIYRRCITVPFSELAMELAPMFDGIDSKLVCTPRRISRVCRDTRFTKDKSLFRDHIWISVSRPKERFEQIPEFYFCIEQAGFSLGCGYYQASAGSMDSIRELILSDDKSFKAAKKALEIAPEFILEGEMYKRDHFPNESEENKNWINRKSICINYSSNDFDMLFSDELAVMLKEEFMKIAPFYHFLEKAEENIVKKRVYHYREDF